MKRKKISKLLTVAVLLIALVGILSVTAFAADNVASVVESTWTDAKAQIKSVVDNVVFPALTLILAVLFFAKVGTSYFEYRKHGQFEFTAPAILFACLIFTITAPLYIWKII